MGKFFADLFSSWGWKVESYDILPERSSVSVEEISNFDVVLLSVPARKIPEVLEEIRPHISKDTLLIDISSVKGDIAVWIEDLDCEQLILHPLFGPDMEVQGSSMAVLGCRGDRARLTLDRLKKSGLRLFEVPLHEHDGRMALLQGLPLLSILFVPYYLLKKGLLDDAFMGTPNLKAIIELSSRMANGNPETYNLILENLFKMEERIVEEFREYIDDLRDNGVEPLLTDLGKNLNGDLHGIIFELLKLRDTKGEVSDLRSAIDVIDILILSLIEKRVEFAKILGELKMANGLPVVDPNIERERINRIVSRSKLNHHHLESIFRGIIELTKSEELLHLGFINKVAILGPEGSFSEEAGLKITGSRAPLVHCSTISEVFSLVENGEVEIGVVPVENSIEGLVGVTFDELVQRDVRVIGEVSVRVDLCLAGMSQEMEDIRTLYSHPVAVGQCMKFIQSKLPHVEIKFTNSTSEAVKKIDKNSVAIVSKNAVLRYGLKVLEDSIQDSKDVITRFYIISRNGDVNSGSITGLIFSVKDESGALVRVLRYFEERNINMRLLVSRPSRIQRGEYLFLVEIEKGLSDMEIMELSGRTRYLKVLGRFSPVKSIHELIDSGVI